MTANVYIYEGKAYLDAAHTELFSTRVSFGDDFTLTVHFPTGLVQAGQWLMVAVDRDMLFGEDGTSPMSKAVVLLDNPDSCTIALPTNSISFYEAVNGARIPVSCYLGIYAFDDVDESDSDAGYPQRQLALATIQALPVVATLRDTVVPLKPQDLYYTKSEVDASFVANSEKGVADGVATLDESGKIPKEQIPEGGSIVIDDALSTTSKNPVQNKVITLALQTKADLVAGKVPSSQLPADIINTIDTITVNGTPAPISDRTVALTIPQPTEQVQADWTETDTSKKSYILHKPDLTIYVEKEVGKGLSTNDFSNSLKSKLDGIEAGAEVNAQADWTETDTTSDAYIKHKPTLATVATSGSYNDLTDKPTIPQPVPQVQADWDESDSTDVSYIQNKPVIPTAPIIGTTAPTTATVGEVGQPYVNISTGQVFTCKSISNTGTEAEPVYSYNWIGSLYAWNSAPSQASKIVQSNGVIQFYSNNVRRLELNSYGIRIGGSNNSATASMSIGNGSKTSNSDSLAVGWNSTAKIRYQTVLGQNNADASNCLFIVGNGTSAATTHNGLTSDLSGNLYIAGGHQQEITEIPSATTSYTPAEGVYNHAPSSAPTYTLPTISDATRTHEVIIYVTFSASALSVAFQTAGGSTITPAPEPDISAGKKYCFLCQYIFGAWQVMSIDMGGGE